MARVVCIGRRRTSVGCTDEWCLLCKYRSTMPRAATANEQRNLRRAMSFGGEIIDTETGPVGLVSQRGSVDAELRSTGSLDGG